ncbi:hypothetical protein SAY87_023839 [Trapa incisa]|uniref:PORR domain-containing protein n=1 Tax=Trapa incisa TaxID=236973 RepID=A0AAN7QUN6_9MYRT|nr:hypothetical protein SAY87_023839 [Trapa incisa]
MVQFATRRTKLVLKNPELLCGYTSLRSKMTSAHYVASRARDATFEKLMDKYKHYSKVVAIQDLILASVLRSSSLSLQFLDRLSQRLHLNRGAASFLRKYPHVFHIFYDPAKCLPFCRLTDAALAIAREESEAIKGSLPDVVDRLVRLLSMSTSKSLPLRAIFKVWRELGLPDDFEDSVISPNPHIFQFSDAHEPNTHILKLVSSSGVLEGNPFVAAVEKWRAGECCDGDTDRADIKFGFKHGFPPGMRLSKDFKAKVKKWQRLPYVGPYEEMGEKRMSKAGVAGAEKRAVAVAHEFLNLTIEKMVEVEKISHFRKWFGIDLNIRDLFLDHPGIFYLSTKGKTHTIFLREAYERGCLIEPNLVYLARRKLLDLVLLGCHAMLSSDPKLGETTVIEHKDEN